MQAEVAQGSHKTLVAAWSARKPAKQATNLNSFDHGGVKQLVGCNDFAWSKNLFRAKAGQLAATVLKMTVQYSCGSYGSCGSDISCGS
jgi:hypothetical protein